MKKNIIIIVLAVLVVGLCCALFLPKLFGNNSNNNTPTPTESNQPTNNQTDSTYHKSKSTKPCFVYNGEETTDKVEITMNKTDGEYETVSPEIKYDSHYIKMTGEYESNVPGEHTIVFSLKSPSTRCWEGTEDTDDIELVWIAKPIDGEVTDPVETNPEESTVPEETKPEETKPEETKPSETNPVETETEPVAHEHKYKKAEEVAPTCIKDGYVKYKCTTCGDSYKEVKPATGHKYGEWKVTKQPTETKEGEKTKTCSVCGDKITRAIDLIQHDYKATVTNPTCTEQGYTTYKCKDCGKEYKDDYVPALGHSWGSWKTTSPATCTKAGVSSRTCSRCKKTESRETAALGHSWKAATCTAPKTCSRCGTTEGSALGHRNTEVRNKKEATATTDGYTGDTYCKDCNQLISKGEIIPCLGTEGLKYELQDDDTYVCTGMQYFTDENIIIASVYNGKPVVGVSKGAFSSKTNIKTVTLSDNILYVDENAFWGCSKLENVIFGTKIKSIGKQAFYKSGLKSVVIPDTVLEVGTCAFAECASLETATIGNKCKTLSGTFKQCVCLQKIVIPDSVTTIHSAFSDCANMRDVTIGKNVTDIDWDAFLHCDVRKMTINSQWAVDNYFKWGKYCGDHTENIIICENVKSIGDYAFVDDGDIKNITLPNTIETIGEYAFKNCHNLEKIIIPDSVKSIGNHAFASCFNLCEITLSNNLTKIQEGTFSLTSISSIIIPASVIEIGDGAFGRCNNLKTVTIDKNTTLIDSGAFDCVNIKTVYYNGTKEQWAQLAKGNTWLSNATVIYG